MRSRVLISVVVVVALAMSPITATAEVVPAPTVVTITFNDGTSDQLPMPNVLDSLGRQRKRPQRTASLK